MLVIGRPDGQRVWKRVLAAVKEIQRPLLGRVPSSFPHQALE